MRAPHALKLMMALLIYFVLPILFALFIKKVGPKVPRIILIVPALLIWIPYEPSLFGLEGLLPNLQFLSVGRTQIPWVLFLALCNLWIIYFVILKFLKWKEFLINFNNVSVAFRGLVVLAPVLLMTALALGFVNFSPKSIDALFLLRWVQIFLLIALPEEILFRGVIQNFFNRGLGWSGFSALAVGAIIFGWSHINNSTANHSPPNIPYVILGGLAGLGYGWVYLKTKSLSASALVHATVNFIWWLCFK